MDSAQLCPDDVLLVQRFILAAFYFGTSGADWDEAGSFLTAESECLWVGIECNDSNRVTAIRLDNSGLNGSLVPEIGYLSVLSTIDLDSNDISGTIPTTLGRLVALDTVDLDTNSLKGTIPEELYEATTLRVLDLDNNSLTGTISSQVEQLSSLFYLQIDSNMFTGSLPSELGSLSSLKYVTAFGNDFTSIAQEICADELTLYADCNVCEAVDCCTACLSS